MGEDDPINQSRLERDGWMLEQRLVVKRQGFLKGYVCSQKRIMRKQCKEWALEARYWIQGYSDVWEFTLKANNHIEIHLTDANWADFDQRGRICFTRNGGIHVIEPLTLEPRELCNFSSSTFSELAPPDWATKW